MVPGLTPSAGLLERLITMKTAECEGIEETGALLAEACAARVESVEPIPGSHNVKAVVDAGPLGRKTVVCGAPNCRPGLLTAYVPLEEESGQRGGERRHAGERRGTRDQSRSRRHYRTRFARRLRARCSHRDRQQKHHAPPRPVGSPRHGARSGGDPRAGTHRPGQARSSAARSGGGQDRDRRSRSLPAVQRAGFRERHGAAVAVVAAIPADGDRPQPDQQHRRYDELRDGRTGAADARVRRGPAARGHHLRPCGEARRTVPRAQRRSVHARPVEPGDRGFGGRDRAGGGDRRRGQRDQREDDARGAGKRQFPGVVDTQDFVRDQAAHRCQHALREGAGSGEHGPRAGARGGTDAGDFAGHPAGGRRWRIGCARWRRRR